MVTNGKALIIYATMTRNTEKIATWFKETFEHYNFETTMFRMRAKADWKGMQDKLYFDDYDVVCLGSPIVAGSPLMIVTKALSLGGGG
jgi:flavodoxin